MRKRFSRPLTSFVVVACCLALATLSGCGIPLSEDPPESLLGKMAPAFELEEFDGGRVNLAEHKDRNVVMLDFWATWCGPCRQGLPTLARVAAEFQHRDVVFYAIDLREDKATIEKFLTANDLDISVLLDSDGEVANRYRVLGIPQTVVIGKDGTVQAVHVGLAPNAETLITEELEAILAGKNLTAETPTPEARSRAETSPTSLR